MTDGLDQNADQQARLTRLVVGSPSDLDRHLSPPDVWRPQIGRHQEILPWLATFANRQDVRVLEIGSRSVVTDGECKKHLPHCKHTGLDIIEGPGVDVVGVAHRLSELFPCDSVDIMYSSAVFEHLAMPWLIAEEIAKVLRVGGYVCIETHFSYAAHEMPWHFMQFSHKGLEILFNPALGFKVIDSGLDTPMVGRFANDAAEHLKGQPIGCLYCHSSIIAQKQLSVLARSQSFDWRSSLAAALQGSMYPAPTSFFGSGDGKDGESVASMSAEHPQAEPSP